MDHDSVKLGCEWNLNSHTRGFIAANVDGKKIINLLFQIKQIIKN